MELMIYQIITVKFPVNKNEGISAQQPSYGISSSKMKSQENLYGLPVIE